MINRSGTDQVIPQTFNKRQLSSCLKYLIGNIQFTLPETNLSPENWGPLDVRRFLLETIISRCYACFREGKLLFYGPKLLSKWGSAFRATKMLFGGWRWWDVCHIVPYYIHWNFFEGVWEVQLGSQESQTIVWSFAYDNNGSFWAQQNFKEKQITPPQNQHCAVLLCQLGKLEFQTRINGCFWFP